MEMGLLKLQAETAAESQAICGIIEMTCRLLPDAPANNHGTAKVGRQYRNWCLIPDGHLDGVCRKKHTFGHGCNCLQDGIVAGIRRWSSLPWNYVFKALSAPKKGGRS